LKDHKVFHKPDYKLRIADYNANPKLCQECNIPIDYEKRLNRFCGSSCSCTFTNRLRPPKSQEEKDKISASNRKYRQALPPKIIDTNRQCFVCNRIFSLKFRSNGVSLRELYR
jgi:hypothetical protein